MYMPASSRSEIFAVSIKNNLRQSRATQELKKPECRKTAHAVFKNYIFIIDRSNKIIKTRREIFLV
jgi:hypothetical protein